MKKYFLHGMGGGPNDWERVLAETSGEAISITKISNISAAIEEIIHKISTEESTICGYSMGGRLAILATERLIQLARPPKKLILVSTGMGYFDEIMRSERRKIDLKWAELARANTKDFWEAWYQQELFSSYQSLSTDCKKAWMNERFSINIGHLSSQIENLSPANHGDLRPLLGEFLRRGISVLYIVGELDKKYLSEARSLNEISVKVIPKAGHILPLEAPKALAEMINNF